MEQHLRFVRINHPSKPIFMSLFKKRYLIFPIFLLLFFACDTPTKVQKKTDDIITSEEVKKVKPKLMVVISVDQMRYDYLERFEPYFQHGLKRLLTEGAVMSNAFYEHSMTGTAPGHATLSTGCHPSKHGVIENNFFNPETADIQYSVRDKNVKIIGVKNNEKIEGVSPKNLLKSGLGDWLKSKNKKSKVFSVALKDRSSILMGGQHPDRAFWFENSSAKFVSSDYYGNDYPEWANAYNGRIMMKEELNKGWHKKMDESVYSVSRSDFFEQEEGQQGSEFPHTIETIRPPYRTYPDKFKRSLLLWSSPYGDAFALKFAEAIIENEKLGTDEDTDLLFVGCSSADVIGHHFGPYSQEVQDYYLYLDGYLGQFLSYLDQNIGKENYYLALSADHGVVPMPEHSAANGLDAKRIRNTEFQDAIDQAEKATKEVLKLQNDFILTSGFQGISLTYGETNQRQISGSKLRSTLAKELKKIDFVEDVFTSDQLEKGGKNPYLKFYQKSFRQDRGNEIKMHFKKYYLIDYAANGTTHGTPYDYDAHIPIIFTGPTIQPGTLTQKIGIVDLAPTLGHILGLKKQKRIDGKVIELPKR